MNTNYDNSARHLHSRVGVLWRCSAAWISVEDRRAGHDPASLNETGQQRFTAAFRPRVRRQPMRAVAVAATASRFVKAFVKAWDKVMLDRYYDVKVRQHLTCGYLNTPLRVTGAKAF
jgi:hypothetical protein